jgi:hypothetical protein
MRYRSSSRIEALYLTTSNQHRDPAQTLAISRRLAGP